MFPSVDSIVCKNTIKAGKETKFKGVNQDEMIVVSPISWGSRPRFLWRSCLFASCPVSPVVLLRGHLLAKDVFSVQSTQIYFSSAPLIFFQFILPIIHPGKRAVSKLTKSRTESLFWIRRYSAGRWVSLGYWCFPSSAKGNPPDLHHQSDEVLHSHNFLTWAYLLILLLKTLRWI